jgi:L-lactate dehydrogenase complex protein LldE
MRIALFITCYNDLLYPEVGRATVKILTRLGHDVEFPRAQTCCGQMHFNTGYRDQCVPLVKNFADTFGGFDAVVTPSPSCAAMVRHYHATVAADARAKNGDPGLAERVSSVASKVLELSEFLIDVDGTTDVGARFSAVVTYHPTCHGRRLLDIGDRPVRLLQAVEGLVLEPLPNDDECCGFGGTFAVKNADTSVAMGMDKVEDVMSTGASVLAAADTSCLMHIGGLLSRQKKPIRVMHVAEILASDG